MVKIILAYIVLLSISNLIFTGLIFLLYFIMRMVLHYEKSDFDNFLTAHNSHKLYILLIITEIVSLTVTMLLAIWGFNVFRIPHTNLLIATIPILIVVPFIFKIKKLREIIRKDAFDEIVSDHAIYK